MSLGTNAVVLESFVCGPRIKFCAMGRDSISGL